MCLMKYGLNLPFWGKFSEKFLENRLQWICSFETLELGVGVKQIFQIPVGAPNGYLTRTIDAGIPALRRYRTKRLRPQ